MSNAKEQSLVDAEPDGCSGGDKRRLHLIVFFPRDKLEIAAAVIKGVSVNVVDFFTFRTAHDLTVKAKIKSSPSPDNLANRIDTGSRLDGRPGELTGPDPHIRINNRIDALTKRDQRKLRITIIKLVFDRCYQHCFSRSK